MFAFHCPRHKSRVLVWSSQYETVVNAADSVGLVFHCSCGYRGMLVTGHGGRDVVVEAPDGEYVAAA